MRPYFMRQLSARWFDNYLMSCGLLFNVFVLISAVGLISGPSRNLAEERTLRAKIEMEDAWICSEHLQDKPFEFAGRREQNIRIYGRHEIPVKLRHLGTYGRTRQNESIETVEVSYPPPAEPSSRSLIYLLVSSDQKVIRCLSGYGPERSHQLDCMASAGEYSGNECLLPVHQESDCQIMKGTLTDGICRVPLEGRILRPVSSPAERRQ